MKRVIGDVIPIGTPWGGPESRRYLSSFVSTLMKLEKHTGTDEELHQRHETLYRLYLAATGIGVSAFWNEKLAPFPDGQLVDRFNGDYIERSMAYAGLTYSIATKDDIRAGAGAVKRRIVASIDAGKPVLACSVAGQWSIVSGYDNDGDVLMGWDGAQTYWGPPTVKPDTYLGNGMFATAGWPDKVARFVTVEGETAPQTGTADLFRHLVVVMEEQRSKDYNKELMGRLIDDAYCASIDEGTLRDLWAYISDFVGWYAENRCFIGQAIWNTLRLSDDVQEHKPFHDAIVSASDYMRHTHDIAWEAWRAQRATHRCSLRESAPCRWCGGCLRPGDDKDYAAFRTPEMRHRLFGFLQVMDWNDGKFLAEIKGALDLLRS